MFNTGNYISKAGRLFRAVLPVDPPPPRVSASEKRGRSGMMRASLFRLSPLLLLAAALVALAVFFVHDTSPAEAQTSSAVWSATLTVADTGGPDRGCVDSGASTRQCENQLTPNTFSYGGETYTVWQLDAFGDGELRFMLDKTIPDDLKTATLFLGNSRFSLSNARIGDGGIPDGQGGLSMGTHNLAQWTHSLTWTVGQTVSVRLVEGPKVSLLYVQEGDKRLRLSWSAPLGELTKYEVEYKTATAPSEPGSIGDADSDYAGRMDPTTGWIPWHRSGLEPDQVIYGLVNGTEHNVRVRAYNAIGEGPWAEVAGTPAQKPYVYLSAPAGVTEGSSVTVTALLSEALSSNVTIPLTITDNTAEPGDHGTLRSITIRSGRTWGEGSITTKRDADPHHDTFTVAVATDGRLTNRVYAGSDSRVRITIEDLDAPTVSMSFPYPPAPHQWSTGVVTVNDGDSVEMMATLSQALEQDVTIPLEYQRNSAEREDYQPPSGITVKAGNTCGIGTLRTNDDADSDDETLVILLARLTPVVQKGNPAALHITLRDSNAAATTHRFPDGQRTGCPSGQSAPPGTAPVTGVALALSQSEVQENAGQVTLTATLDQPAPAGGLELTLYADAGSTAEKGTDYTLPESITVPYGGLSASVRIGITDDALDEPDETLVIGVFAQTDHATLQDTATLTIADNDGPPQQQQQSPGDQGSLIAKIRQWRSEWDRALLALGETVADATLTPMTAAEARALAGQDWADRWRQTAAALSQPENRAPAVANAMGDVTIVTESGTRQISLSGVFSDADNDSLSITAASSDEAVATVSVAADGSSLTVSARARGTSVITVTAADGRGGTISGSFTVTVKAAPTVALAPAGVSGLEVGSTRDVSLSGVFSDADGDALTVTAASSSDAVATVTVAAGYSSLTVTGVAEGTATITVTAQDADGNRVSHDFDVAVTPAPQQQQVVDPNNNAPTVASAIADATIVKETGTHQVSLSGVFSDADNDSLTVTAASSDTAVATVSVAADQSSLTVTARARGTAAITVTARDGNGGSVSDAFTVTVKAAPVVASALADLSLAEGAAPEVSLSGVFSDADGDALTVTTDTTDENVANAFAFQDTLYVTAFTAGSATVTVTAQDSDGNTVSDQFAVTVAAPQQQQQDPPPNRAPTVAGALADATIVNESGTQQVALSGAFSDADNDALTVTAASGDEAVATVSMASDYSGLTVSAQARGTATITVTADDGNGGTVSDSFTVTVKAAPVVASAISDVSGLEEGSTRDVSLSGVFNDADGDSLTITAASSDNGKATASVASDGSTLTLTGVSEGTATITVTAQDTDGNRVSDAFDVTVVKTPEPDEPDPPTGAPTVAAPIDDISLEGPESREIDLDGVFSGESLTFSAVTSDYGVATMWVSGSTLTVLGTGTGTATITVTAEDPNGNWVSDEFEVTVSPSIQEQ